MFACLHLPDFPLQARLRRQPGWRWEPVGILNCFDENPADASAQRRSAPQLVALTRSAAEAGVEPGMTAAQGQARCGRLRVITRNRGEEMTTRDALLEAAARVSADFEDTGPGLATVDLSSLPGIDRPGAIERLGHEWVAAFADLELNLQTGFAPNPDLAALASRLAEPVHVFRGDNFALREQLARLPLDLINPPNDYRAILTLWGIDTLGDFTSLPRDELAERLGPDAIELWDQASGRCRRLLRLVRPPKDFALQVDLDFEITSLEPLMFLIRRTLETLAARLASAYLATSEMRLVLQFSDGASSEQTVRVPDPSGEVDRPFRLLQTRLTDLKVARPIEAYRLEVTPARPGEKPFHLFETTLRDPNRFAETLAQVEALVGSENVGSPEPRDTHRPDAFAMREFDPDSAKGNRETAASPLPAIQGLPLRRFRPRIPIDLETRTDPKTGARDPAEIISGQVRGRLRQLAGPWRLSGEWWEKPQHWRREEWDIQLEDGSLYRIACAWEERGGEKVAVWYLEGVYG
ncbi:MAG: DNA polymerase Y family protein [Verrucomicrobiae bacterium]|nr:DNA polymerase Y family protein [Verrucomicrobiae bacterium]